MSDCIKLVLLVEWGDIELDDGASMTEGYWSLVCARAQLNLNQVQFNGYESPPMPQ